MLLVDTTMSDVFAVVFCVFGSSLTNMQIKLMSHKQSREKLLAIYCIYENNLCKYCHF